MRDCSVVSFELEARGRDVLLVLTHRRVREWLAGAGTALAIAVLVVFVLPAGAGDPPAARSGRAGSGPLRAQPEFSSA